MRVSEREKRERERGDSSLVPSSSEDGRKKKRKKPIDEQKKWTIKDGEKATARNIYHHSCIDVDASCMQILKNDQCYQWMSIWMTLVYLFLFSLGNVSTRLSVVIVKDPRIFFFSSRRCPPWFDTSFDQSVRFCMSKRIHLSSRTQHRYFFSDVFPAFDKNEKKRCFWVLRRRRRRVHQRKKQRKALFAVIFIYHRRDFILYALFSRSRAKKNC